MKPTAAFGDDIGLLIFDLDGTLVRFGIDWSDVRARLQRMLDTDDDLRPLLPALEALDLDEERRRHAYGLIDDIELAVARTFVRDDGLARVLDRLSANGRRLALVTLQGRRAAVEALERVGIQRFFGLIVARDDTSNRGSQIERCLVTLGVTADSTVVIADRAADMAEAKARGCRTVAVGDRPGVVGDRRVAGVGELPAILGLEDP